MWRPSNWWLPWGRGISSLDDPARFVANFSEKPIPFTKNMVIAYAFKAPDYSVYLRGEEPNPELQIETIMTGAQTVSEYRQKPCKKMQRKCRREKDENLCEGFGEWDDRMHSRRNEYQRRAVQSSRFLWGANTTAGTRGRHQNVTVIIGKTR